MAKKKNNFVFNLKKKKTRLSVNNWKSINKHQFIKKRRKIIDYSPVHDYSRWVIEQIYGRDE